MHHPLSRFLQASCAITLILSSGLGCNSDSSSTSSATFTCSAVTGYRTSVPSGCAAPLPVSSWTPDAAVIGSGNGFHDATVLLTKATTTVTGKVTGLGQSYADSSHKLSVSFTIGAGQLGTSGSVSLVARLTSFPSNLSGLYGWPVLVSLTAPNSTNTGTVEWVKLTPECEANGFFATPGDYTTYNCSPALGSTFIGTTANARLSNYDMAHRIGIANEEYSVASFPSCKWSTGTEGCPFNTNAGGFLDAAAKLPPGTYTATYVVLTNSQFSGDCYNAAIDVSVIQKKDNTGISGAVDVNVVLVGDQNITDANSVKGQQNLNLLMKEVQRIYSSVNSGTTGIKLGKINAYNWSNANGGGGYASLDTSELGVFFQSGSMRLSCTSAAAPSEGKALNVFLVSDVTDGGVPSGILGVAGGIPGVPLNGTQASGLVFSTMDKLGTYNNTGCGTTGIGACPQTAQDASFIDMGGTIAHEMGHYFGLRHPDERLGITHDTLDDTPECKTTTTYLGYTYINQVSCRDTSTESACASQCKTEVLALYGAGTDYTFTSSGSPGKLCPASNSCGFNHVMWWASKNIIPSMGIADGNIFSAHSGTVVNFSPYVQ